MGWNKSIIRGFDEGWNISAAGIPQATAIGVGPAVGGSGTAMTYTNANIGTASPTRRVFFAAGGYTSGVNIVSATIGGIAATVIQNGTGESLQFLLTAVVPTGTTATVAVTTSGSNFTSGEAYTWTCDDSLLLSSTPTAGYVNDITGSVSTLTASLTTSLNGFSLLYFYTFGATPTISFGTSDDVFTIDRNSTPSLRAHCNGTQSRTASTTINTSANTKQHMAIWNFR